ncbi:MAG: hypothetical protein GY719_17650 [bacterium]|nr:hypothetical protein [bacterium]
MLERWPAIALLLVLATPTHAFDLTEPVLGVGTCTPGPTVLCFQDNRFSVEIDWRDFDANTGAGQVLPVALPDTGFFYFTDPEQPEIYVQVLDGTAINTFYWVFAGALTNWQYTLTVTDTVTRQVNEYPNPLGTLASIIDTSAFPEGTRGADGGTAPAPEPGPADRGIITCVSDDTTLCLDDDRFQVQVVWEDFVGTTGTAQVTALTDLSGYMTFFNPTGITMAVKIVDGGDGNFAFFYGATTDVEYTITVTDVCTGAMKTYFKPLGTLTSAGDFAAFPVTPSCTTPIFTDGFESGDTTAWQ